MLFFQCGRQRGSKGILCNVSLGLRDDENHENIEGQHSDEDVPGSEEEMESTSSYISPSLTSEDGPQASRFIWKSSLRENENESSATFGKPAQHYRMSEKHKKYKKTIACHYFRQG